MGNENTRNYELLDEGWLKSVVDSYLGRIRDVVSDYEGTTLELSTDEPDVKNIFDNIVKLVKELYKSDKITNKDSGYIQSIRTRLLDSLRGIQNDYLVVNSRKARFGDGLRLHTFVEYLLRGELQVAQQVSPVLMEIDVFRELLDELEAKNSQKLQTTFFTDNEELKDKLKLVFSKGTGTSLLKVDKKVDKDAVGWSMSPKISGFHTAHQLSNDKNFIPQVLREIQRDIALLAIEYDGSTKDLGIITNLSDVIKAALETISAQDEDPTYKSWERAALESKRINGVSLPHFLSLSKDRDFRHMSESDVEKVEKGLQEVTEHLKHQLDLADNPKYLDKEFNKRLRGKKIDRLRELSALATEVRKKMGEANVGFGEVKQKSREDQHDGIAGKNAIELIDFGYTSDVNNNNREEWRAAIEGEASRLEEIKNSNLANQETEKQLDNFISFFKQLYILTDFGVISNKLFNTNNLSSVPNSEDAYVSALKNRVALEASDKLIANPLFVEIIEPIVDEVWAVLLETTSVSNWDTGDNLVKAKASVVFSRQGVREILESFPETERAMIKQFLTKTAAYHISLRDLRSVASDLKKGESQSAQKHYGNIDPQNPAAAIPGTLYDLKALKHPILFAYLNYEPPGGIHVSGSHEIEHTEQEHQSFIYRSFKHKGSIKLGDERFTTSRMMPFSLYVNDFLMRPAKFGVKRHESDNIETFFQTKNALKKIIEAIDEILKEPKKIDSDKPLADVRQFAIAQMQSLGSQIAAAFADLDNQGPGESAALMDFIRSVTVRYIQYIFIGLPYNSNALIKDRSGDEIFEAAYSGVVSYIKGNTSLLREFIPPENSPAFKGVGIKRAFAEVLLETLENNKENLRKKVNWGFEHEERALNTRKHLDNLGIHKRSGFFGWWLDFFTGIWYGNQAVLNAPNESPFAGGHGGGHGEKK